MKFPGPPLNYVLVDGKPVPEPDILKWATWFEDFEKRLVREDFFLYKNRALVVIDRKTYVATCEFRTQFRTLTAEEHGQDVPPFREFTAEELNQNSKAQKKRAELGGVPIKLSTIFLGFDHGFNLEGPPVLWETMMFEVNHRDFGQHRYNSATKAMAGHLLLLQTLMSTAKVGKLQTLFRRDEGKEEAVGGKGEA